MASFPNPIDVPKAAKGSFNPNRDAGLLLRSQARHMREALIKHMAEVAEVLAIDVNTLKSEAHISDYVHRATKILHRHPAVTKGK